jgi:hypothetical protein
MPHIVPSTTTNVIPIQILKHEPNFLENSPFCWWLSEGQTKLPPEVERDNVEYKVKMRFLETIFIIIF